MIRHIFIAFVIFSQFLLQYINVSAQAKKITDTNIEYIIPGDSWKLITNNIGTVSLIGYQRETLPGDKVKPTISFMVEKLTEKPNSHDFFLNKIRQVGLKPSIFLSSSDKIHMGVLGSYLCKGYYTANGNKDSVYLGCFVTSSRAITFICEAPAVSFHNYDDEFISFLKSVNYAGAASNNGKTDISSTKSAATEKNTAAKGPVIQLCDYFPLVDGMQYSYKRSDMTGVHTVMEVYNHAREKVIKNGTTLKGFRIKSTIEDRNNTTIYYYCSDGSINMYAEMPGYDTHITGYKEDYSIFPSEYNKPDYLKTPIWETDKVGTGKYLSLTQLKAGSIGDIWTDVQEINGNIVIISSKIAATDLSVTAGGRTFSSVVHIQRTVSIKILGEVQELNKQDLYYAKGVGKIKAVETGHGILGGDYTTSEELISSNLIRK